MRIAPAGPATDWTAVRALLVDAFTFMDGRIDPPSSLHQLGPAELAALPGLWLLAHETPGVVGCLQAAPRDGALHLSKIAADPTRRRQGVARALIAGAMAQARAQGLAALTLQSRVTLTDTHAAFLRLGFVETGRTAHPGFDCPTSVTFRKALT